jgi:hypothetical protein
MGSWMSSSRMMISIMMEDGGGCCDGGARRSMRSTWSMRRGTSMRCMSSMENGEEQGGGVVA